VTVMGGSQVSGLGTLPVAGRGNPSPGPSARDDSCCWSETGRNAWSATFAEEVTPCLAKDEHHENRDSHQDAARIPAPSSRERTAHGRMGFTRRALPSARRFFIIFWTSFSGGEYADPCADLISPPVDPSAADLAVAVSTAPGTELVTGPSDVTIGGRAAKHVVLAVRENVGCDPGFFYTWQDVEEGALWPMTSVGDTIRVWIVDVGGTRLFIEAETSKQAGSDLEQEIRQIVESIRFD
jgi:hypothetical protein